MKKCELCKSAAARMYCDSDRAYLCWDCDARVHSANFLVKKHARTLLCRACQSPTPWTGSGSKLAETVSLCDSCVGSREKRVLCNGDATDDEEEDDDDDGGDDVIDDDDGENQVVPFSLPQSLPSSSSSEESSSSSSGREGNSISRFGLLNCHSNNCKSF